MHNKILKSKKAAIELSIGTIVVIVIAMTMLVLGLILVKNIFSGATESVDSLNSKVMNEITQLFSDEGAEIVVKLGSDKTAKIKQGTDSFSVGIGARTSDGSSMTRDRLTYTLTFGQAGTNCVKSIGLSATKNLFITPLDIENKFDDLPGDKAFARIQLKVPKGTNLCTQKVFIDVKDTEISTSSPGSSFIFEVIKSGFF